MRRQMILLGLVGMMLAVCAFAACSARVGAGGGLIVAQFTIGGKTFTFTFGSVGPIAVQANQTTRVPVGFDLFEQAPADAPTSARMTLPCSSVGVGRRLTEKAMVRAQELPLSGAATIRLSIASGVSAAACDSAVLLAEYHLVYTYGVPAITDETQDLSAEALAIIAANSVTICIEITADFDAEITLGEFTLSFGGGGVGAAEFNMHNADTVENIHILLPNEDFDASNRLVPGASRTVTMVDLASGTVITARVGRNGTVLDTTDCPAITGSNYQAEVEWDGLSVTCTATQDTSGTGTDHDDVIIPPGTIIQVPIDNDGGQAVAAPVTNTYNGIDYGIVGVLDAHTEDVTSPPLQAPSQISINLDTLGLESVQHLYMATASAFVPDVPDGVTIATLTCDYADGGSPTTLDFILGQNTSEWSYDRPEHTTLLGGVQHARAPELYSFQTTNDSAQEYTGYIYDVSLGLDSTRTLACMTLTIIDGATLAAMRSPELTPVPTWAGHVITGVTLEGPAGTPAMIGDCSGTTTTVGTVSGSVVDAGTGTAIAGATVTLDGLQTVTGSAGEFTFTNVAVSTVTVTASADGYQTSSETATVIAGATTAITIELTPVSGPIGSINGTVTDADTGVPLAGAIVRLDYSPGPAVSATTGADGTYDMSIPEIPDFFALTAALDGYIPESVNVERASLEGTTATIDFALEPMNSGVVVIEVVPDVHHLGDDSYSGAVNSQFQKMSEGLEYTATFQVTADQLPPAYNSAELRAVAKGTENYNPIVINGTTLDTPFLGTPFDGSFGEWTTTFDIALLVTGSNTITIRSAMTTDYDDFEFVNVQIWLAP